MQLKEYIKEDNNVLTRKDVSLTDFLNYAKKSGYLVYGNEEHWIKEYQEYIRGND